MNRLLYANILCFYTKIIKNKILFLFIFIFYRHCPVYNRKKPLLTRKSKQFTLNLCLLAIQNSNILQINNNNNYSVLSCLIWKVKNIKETKKNIGNKKKELYILNVMQYIETINVLKRQLCRQKCDFSSFSTTYQYTIYGCLCYLLYYVKLHERILNVS
jgi:hypothetical protein